MDGRPPSEIQGYLYFWEVDEVMWLSTVYLEDLMEDIMKYSLEKGAEDVVLNGYKKNTWLIRFSKNSLDITRFHDESWIEIYLGIRKRRLFSGLNIVDEAVAKEQIDNMVKTIDYIPPYPLYVNLPDRQFNYIVVPDTFVDEIDLRDLADRLSNAVKIGKDMRMQDVSGSLLVSQMKHIVYTSTGNRGEYKRSNLNLNLRIFKKKDISYIVNQETVDPSKLEVEEGVSRYGEFVKKISRISSVKPGKYNVVLSPVVIGNLFNYLARGLSAMFVMMQNSPFVDKLGEKVLDDSISLCDKPLLPGNPGACSFDQEGIPTRDLYLFKDGVVNSYLHNLSTAKKFGTESTGHAGFVIPMPHSLIIESTGSSSFEDLLVEVKDALYITNVWYTRFQNYTTGDFSTIQRDVGFIVKDGEPVEAVTGARISDNIVDMFRRVIGMSKESEWVKWWDYTVPSQMPYIALKDIGITTAF